jgi:uncharacterized protein
MSKALIVFVKNAVLGKVKTRLAADLGAQKALEIYLELLRHTHEICEPLDFPVFVYYSEYVEQTDIWSDKKYIKKAQLNTTDLGLRMEKALLEVFDLGYDSVVLIGSDNYEISTEIIRNAFDQLMSKNAILGPAKDGGYYAIGLQKGVANHLLLGELFKAKTWSHDQVYAEAEKTFTKFQTALGTLPKLADIDTLKDILESNNPNISKFLL